MACFAHLRAGWSGVALVTSAAALKAIVLAAMLLSGAASPVAAQGFGWFGNLLGGGQRAQTGYPGFYNRQPDSFYAPRRRAPRRHATEPVRAAREKDGVARDGGAAKAPAKTASTFVYVFGDSFGQSLAAGLEDALVDRADVAVVRKAKGSSGLVASDFHDWPKAIEELLAKMPPKVEPGKGGQAMADSNTPNQHGDATADLDKIDVAVMMVGSNDRQPLRDAGQTFAVGTPEWTAAYKKRVMRIDEAFHRRNIPLVWVGVPIARDDDFADDMAAFNDIYREAAAKTGAVYVDTWEAFSDDHGDFSPTGPDINGQIARLRTADGVYFTKAGGRKLAHFVEVHVRRALDGKIARTASPEASAPARNAVVPKPDVGAISSLTDPPLAHEGRLALRATRDPRGEPETNHPQVGRADDLRWPARAGPSP